MATFPGDKYQEDNSKTINRAGYDTGANAKARFACQVLGWGENNMRDDGCISSNHCGIFQLSSTLQAEHDYHDVYYWAKRAYTDGFWGRGGLKALAVQYPHESAGYIVNLCQGAYSDLNQGAAYYDQYQTIAKEGLAAIGSYGSHGGTHHSTPSPLSTAGLGKLLKAYNPSTIIRHDFFRLGTYGRHTSEHAKQIRGLVERVKFVDTKGPGY